MIYVCPVCKKKERVQKKIIFHCDDCSVIMLQESILNITGKTNKEIGEADLQKGYINTAKAMKRSFPGLKLKWTDKYLAITKKINEVTPDMIEKFE